jgi:CubicO group peptidase (beta-lactamase class C family)
MSYSFTWQLAAPEDHGFAPQGLDALLDTFVARRTRAFLLVRDDRILCEWYAPDFGPDRRHYTASLAKSLVGGLALSIARQDGRIELNDFVADYVPSWKADAAKSQVRMLHLATHCSGLDDAEEAGLPHDLLPSWKGAFWKRQPTDPFTIARDQAPIIFEPGTRFLYSNPGSAMLSYAITAALRAGPHADVRTLLRERIFAPVGIDDSEWRIGYGATYTVDGLPLVPSWGGGDFTARATARIGRLMLRDGHWQGRRILDSHLLGEATTYAGTPRPDRSAAYPWPVPTPGWWCNADGALPTLPRDAFCGAGAGNQILLVIPSLDMVVVRYGGYMGEGPNGRDFWAALREYLFDPLSAALVSA